MRVLVATDLSDAGMLAIETLLGCNPELFGAVTLLHVIAAEEYMADISAEEIMRFAEERLGEEAAGLEQAGFMVEHRIEQGPAAERVQKVADEIGADLIVVTDRGRSGAPGRLLGSTSEKIALAGDTPVYVERVEERDANWCRLGAKAPFARPYIAADIDEGLPRVARVVSRLPGVAEVRVAHVASSARSSLDEREFIANEIAATPIGGAEIAVLHGSDPAKTIMKDAEMFGATLIALAPRRHGIVGRVVFGSVALSLLRESRLPLLFA